MTFILITGTKKRFGTGQECPDESYCTICLILAVELWTVQYVSGKVSLDNKVRVIDL